MLPPMQTSEHCITWMVIKHKRIVEDTNRYNLAPMYYHVDMNSWEMCRAA